MSSPGAHGGDATTPPPPPPRAGEGATAWDELVARWDDPEAHRRFLDGQRDLDGLAWAGRRYREVLDEHPGDAAAQRGRDEVLRRATVVGLAALPRATPAPRERPAARRFVVLLLAGLVAAGAAWTVVALLRTGGVQAWR